MRLGQLELRFLISAVGATVFEFTGPSRARVPAPHSHRDADECRYGREGALTVSVDGQTREIRAG
ncbi:cupin domain-containing protein, partial [Rhizobium leguminosarum]